MEQNLLTKAVVDDKVIECYAYYIKRIGDPVPFLELCVGSECFAGNPYKIGRNTGIRVNDKNLYEFDLISFSVGINRDKRMGAIMYDGYMKAWAIKASSEYSSMFALKDANNIEVIGTLLLEEDIKRFDEYSKQKESANEGKTECRSASHINRMAKMFLPR